VRLAIEALEDRSLLSLFGVPTVYLTPLAATFSKVAVGDFDGDSKPDLAVAGGDARALSLLRNKGDGTFAAAISQPLDFSPDSLAVADFNGDGKLDLVTGGTTTDPTTPNLVGTVRVLFGNGDGTFATQVTLPAGTLPLSVATGDFNGDGRPDIVAANWPDGTVSMYLNRSNGTFASSVHYSVGPTARWVTVADLNGDGKPDLVLSGPDIYLNSAVSVLLNHGDGTFASPITYTTLQGAEQTAVADMNGDGKPDLVVPIADPYIGKVAILLGKGDGTFASPFYVGSGKGTLAVAVAEFNEDGLPDLAVVNNLPYQGENLAVLLNNGSGGFSAPDTFQGGYLSVQVVAADLNGDGKPDLVAPYASAGGGPPGSVYVLLNTTPGRFTTPGAFDPATSSWYLRNRPGPGAPSTPAFSYGSLGWTPVFGDWNGDGPKTVGAVDQSGLTNNRDAVWYLRNSSNAGPPDLTPFPYGTRGWVPVVGDWSGTGHDGIGMFDRLTGTWYLRNEASAGPPDAGVFQYGGIGWLPVTGDWNGDGMTTIGVVDPRTVTWYLRNSNSSGAPDLAPFQYGGIGWLPVTGDWNGDGMTTIGVVDRATMTWYLRNENSAGLPDGGIFQYGGAGWLPLGGPVPVPGYLELATLGEDPIAPQTRTASRAAEPSAISVPVSAAEQATGGGRSRPLPRTSALRHTVLAGQARAAALDELFATGLE
jgi:hypothetical protein